MRSPAALSWDEGVLICMAATVDLASKDKKGAKYYSLVHFESPRRSLRL
jgi:hypothetical protein